MSRSIVIITPAAVLLVAGAAWLVLQGPDVGRALSFFTLQFPTLAAGEAVLTVLVWIVVVIAALGTLATVLRKMRTSPAERRSTSCALLLLVVGLTLFAMSVVRHSLPSASVCCGSGPANVREAVELAR